MCINIQTKKNPKYQNSPLQPYMISYPCGKCPLCLRKRLSNWIFRIEKEQQRSLTTQFITLTYDDNHLPLDMSVNKRDIQLFHKRLRKNRAVNRLWDNYPLRYILVSEYGTKSTQRPHYHIIAFNYPQHKEIEKIWGNGFVSASILTSARIKYTFKYMGKPAHHPEGRKPNFQLTSQGIGSNYLTPQMVNYHQKSIENCYITKPDGKTMSIPKYYKSKLYGEETQPLVTKYQQQRIESENEKKVANLMQRYRISEEKARQKFELSNLNAKFDKEKTSKL